MKMPWSLVLMVLTLGAVAPAAHAAFTLGSGRPATETRAVGEFEAISTAGSIDIVVRQGAKESVEVTADDNLLPLVETTVESGSRGRTLSIRTQRGASFHTRSPMRVTVTVVKLSAIASSGSGNVEVQALTTPALKLSIAGSSDAVMRGLKTTTLEIGISGSGDVKVDGTATQVRVSIAGSGNAALSELVADDVTVSIAGSGDANVTANKSLDVRVAGSGDVIYGGNAPQVHSKIAGSGSVTKR
jgi:hypothetical protein